MDLIETESFCSNSSSEAHSLPQQDEPNNNLSTSMKLNFGIDRLLNDKNICTDETSLNRNLINENGANQWGLNLFHQQFSQNLLNNPNFVLKKPFPLRFGGNTNGFINQQAHYFQSNFRKMTLTPNIHNGNPYSSAYHNILRLPAVNNLQANSGNMTQYLSQKITKNNSNDAKLQSSQVTNNGVKRKRSWSRAVFSNLQRKGLERQFEFQKYITKPDRKKLAARLGLKDAQVKVWFQNRRMKWRHMTRGTTSTPNSSKAMNAIDNSQTIEDDEQFTSSSDDEDGEIDVVTDN